MNKSLATLATLDREAIRSACCSYVGATERWAEIAQTGASDAELTAHLNREMSNGGSGGPDQSAEYHMRNPPRIWLNMHFPTGEPDLKGKELLDVVRQLFGVHWKPHQDQLSLFE